MSAAELPLFVYGTLRQGERNHAPYLAGRYERIVPAVLPGYRKVVGAHGYDVAEPAPGERLAGELYFLTSASWETTLTRCDELEELPVGQMRGELYQRIAAPVEFAGNCVLAWVYVAP